ncbi:hypothetical protein IWQ60_005881 [Tieghemiomyces parasiticus]|uniref:Complex I-B14.7 n=1 Tax=Tieghemiomyces parasiticus TaxID=78921 RepID=A0A9W8ADX0_9FUNG|nr:hypothetical protein IWQ60_005881 [Tieghemiomyces parasiticus]
MSNPHNQVDLEAIKTEKAYTPKEWPLESIKAAGMGAFSGFCVSSFLTHIQSHNAGAAGVFTRTGYLMPYLAALGGIYAATEGIASNVREEDDFANAAVAGCVTGVLAGARNKSVPLMTGGCLVLGVSMGAYKYFGGFGTNLRGMSKEEVLKYRREHLRLE